MIFLGGQIVDRYFDLAHVDDGVGRRVGTHSFLLDDNGSLELVLRVDRKSGAPHPPRTSVLPVNTASRGKMFVHTAQIKNLLLSD